MRKYDQVLIRRLAAKFSVVATKKLADKIKTLRKMDLVHKICILDAYMTSA